MEAQDKERFNLTIEDSDSDQQFVVVVLEGRLDAYSTDSFKQQMDEILENESAIILDLEDLIYVSSAGLRALYHISDTIDDKDGRLVFCDLHKNVQKMFKIVDVESMFTIVDTRDEAEEIVTDNQ